MIRYADDFVIGVAREDDAQRIMEVLPKRMSKYGLTATRRRPGWCRSTRLSKIRRLPKPRNGGPTRTEDIRLSGIYPLLGTIAARHWVVKRKTARSRLSRGLDSLSRWCRQNRHLPIADQHRTLCQKLVGHFAYYGITGNSVALSLFRHLATDIWRRWLSRQRRDGAIPWSEFTRFLERYPLPPPIAIHSVCRPVART